MSRSVSRCETGAVYSRPFFRVFLSVIAILVAATSGFEFSGNPYAPGSFMNIHSHNNKTGLGKYEFSPLDKDTAKSGNVVEKITESDGAIERIGHSAKAPGYRGMNPSDSIKASDYRASSSDAGNGAQTASEVDARQQAAANRGTGVPSLGAEAVNVPTGPY